MRNSGGKFRYLKVLVLAFALAQAGTLGAGDAAAAAPDAAAVAVPHAQDLRADAHDARARGLPILLLFAAETCGYCIQVEEDYLQPLLTGDGSERILIRKLHVRDTRTLTDFDGGAVEADELAARYRVDLVPTLVFVDAQGRELAERVVGLGTVDFYWGYLSRSIDTARAQVQAAAP